MSHYLTLILNSCHPFTFISFKCCCAYDSACVSILWLACYLLASWLMRGTVFIFACNLLHSAIYTYIHTYTHKQHIHFSNGWHYLEKFYNDISNKLFIIRWKHKVPLFYICAYHMNLNLTFEYYSWSAVVPKSTWIGKIQRLAKMETRCRTPAARQILMDVELALLHRLRKR